VTALAGIERDLGADRAEIEVLLETWKGWSNILAQVEDAPSGSIPAEAQVIARQVLKKVLTGPIVVTPRVDCWAFEGTGRIDRVLQGSVAHGEVVVVRHGQPPIAGGSEGGAGRHSARPGAVVTGPGPRPSR
jgi:hypothetical protein